VAVDPRAVRFSPDHGVIRGHGGGAPHSAEIEIRGAPDAVAAVRAAFRVRVREGTASHDVALAVRVRGTRDEKYIARR
jgi:hypothetical protein